MQKHKTNANPVIVTPTMTLYQIVTADKANRVITAVDPRGNLHTFGPTRLLSFAWDYWGDAGPNRGLVVDEASEPPEVIRLALRQEMKHNVVTVKPILSNHMNSDVVRFCIHLDSGEILYKVSDYRYHMDWQARARKLFRMTPNCVKVVVQSPENAIVYDQVYPVSDIYLVERDATGKIIGK